MIHWIVEDAQVKLVDNVDIMFDQPVSPDCVDQADESDQFYCRHFCWNGEKDSILECVGGSLTLLFSKPAFNEIVAGVNHTKTLATVIW